MRLIFKTTIFFVLSLLAAGVHASDQYLSIGYSESRAEATTTYGTNTQFDTFTSMTLGFSTELYEQYNVGLVVDLEQLENFNLLFGTENSRFRIRKNTVSGQINGQTFEYDETSYLWSLHDSGNVGRGIVCGSYQTLGQHDTYSPATGSDFIPVDVTYVGYVIVSDAFGNKKTGWGAQGINGFIYLDYSPDSTVPLNDSSGFGIYVDIKLGYYKNFGRFDAESGKAILFIGVNMEATMDMTSEYNLPFSLGPSVTFSTKW